MYMLRLIYCDQTLCQVIISHYYHMQSNVINEQLTHSKYCVQADSLGVQIRLLLFSDTLRSHKILHYNFPLAARNIRLVSNNQLDSPDKTALAMPENSDIVSSHSKQNVRSRSPSDIDPEPYYPPRPVSHDSGGVNFYLRLGAIGKYTQLYLCLCSVETGSDIMTPPP